MILLDAYNKQIQSYKLVDSLTLHLRSRYIFVRISLEDALFLRYFSQHEPYAFFYMILKKTKNSVCFFLKETLIRSFKHCSWGINYHHAGVIIYWKKAHHFVLSPKELHTGGSHYLLNKIRGSANICICSHQ